MLGWKPSSSSRRGRCYATSPTRKKRLPDNGGQGRSNWRGRSANGAAPSSPCVKAEHRHLIAGRGDEVNAILNHASDRGTDLIVMGGYGHARIREFVLGGVTRGMLASMTVPVMMSH